jgi:hypothetical protein
MFLTFQHGILYVLSYATMIAAIASTIALALLLGMTACRSVWHLGQMMRKQKETVGLNPDNLLRGGFETPRATLASVGID